MNSSSSVLALLDNLKKCKKCSPTDASLVSTAKQSQPLSPCLKHSSRIPANEPLGILRRIPRTDFLSYSQTETTTETELIAMYHTQFVAQKLTLRETPTAKIKSCLIGRQFTAGFGANSNDADVW